MKTFPSDTVENTSYSLMTFSSFNVYLKHGHRSNLYHKLKKKEMKEKNVFFPSFYIFKMKVKEIRPKWCKNIPEASDSTEKKNKKTDSRQSISVGIYACHHLSFLVNPLTFIMIHNCWRKGSEIVRRRNRQYEWRYIKCGVMGVDAVWDKGKEREKKGNGTSTLASSSCCRFPC
jgi:hypothetical protein